MYKVIKFDPSPAALIIVGLLGVVGGGASLTIMINLGFFINPTLASIIGGLVIFILTALVYYWVSQKTARGYLDINENVLHVVWNKTDHTFDLNKTVVDKWQAIWEVHEQKRKVLVYSLTEEGNSFTFFVDLSWFNKYNLPQKELAGVYIQIRDKVLFKIHPKFKII